MHSAFIVHLLPLCYCDQLRSSPYPFLKRRRVFLSSCVALFIGHLFFCVGVGVRGRVFVFIFGDAD